MSYTQILYQIVFTTKHRHNTLIKEGRTELFKHIWGTLKEKKCHLYQVNCVENHIHIVTHIHPTIALSNLVKDIKVGTSLMIKRNNIFHDFIGWQRDYSAFTYSIKAKRNLIRYVKNQEQHHSKISIKQELITLYKEHGIEYDVKYLEL